MSRSIGAVNYARGIDQGCCVHNFVGRLRLVCTRVLCYNLQEVALCVSHLLGQFEQCDLFHIVYLKIKQN
jgi:hypothetical protein